MTEDSPQRDRLRRWMKVIALSISLLLGFAIGEVVTRLYVWSRYQRRLDRFSSRADVLFVPLPGDARVYENRRSMTHTARIHPEHPETWTYTTNEAGFRGPAPAELKARPRLLVLGDSYTFGWAVGDSETLPAALRAELPEVEVLNGGVPGSNTAQQLALLEARGDELAPDHILLAFVVNDAEPQLSIPTSPAVTYRHCRSWLLARVFLEANRALGDSSGPLPVGLFESSQDYLEGFAPGALKREECRAALAGIVEACRERGCGLSLVILPDAGALRADPYPWTSIHEAASGWCDELGVRAMDLLAPARGSTLEEVAVPHDGHPSAALNALFAKELAPWLREGLREAGTGD